MSIDTTQLDSSSLPADGSCSVSVSFALESGDGFEVWDYATGEPLGEGATFTANNLNRIQITGEGLAFFSTQNLTWTPSQEGYLRFSVGGTPVIAVRVSILQSGGESLSQTQNLTLSEESCDLFLT